MKIEELLNNVNVEDYVTEFKGLIKEGINPETKERFEIGWLKTIVAFANSQGGTLYVGVDNKTHDILALSHNEIDKMALMVQRQIQEHIEPPIKYTIEKIIVPHTSPNRYLLKININKSKFPPISLKINGIPSIYVRHFGKTSPATGEEIRNLVMNSDSVSFDLLDTNIKYNPDDFKTLRSFYKDQNDKELSEKDLINIGFMDTDKFLKRGALLFKDNYNESRAMVECSLFKGANKGDNIFLANERFSTDLISEYKKIISFIESHSASGFIKTETGKTQFVSYPKRSLLEAVINALGHRNYFLDGVQTEINIYIDRLEIISPGSLINSKWLYKETNLSSIPPMRRNKLICEVFAMCKIMDRKGSGFDKIIEEYKPYGSKFSPFADSTDTYFSITLPDVTHKNGLISSIECPNIILIEKCDIKYAEEILSYCYSKKRTAKEIATFLKLQPSTYFRKAILERLISNNLLIIDHNSFPVLYKTNTLKVLPK